MSAPAPRRGSERLYGFFVGRPVALLTSLATLILIGAIAYHRIPIQLFPSGLQEPTLRVFIPNPGSNSRENEEKVARVVEEHMRTLAGVKGVRSWSRDELVRLRVEFNADVDMDLAKAEVRDRLERARPQLPPTIEHIELWAEDADQMPVIWFGIQHDGDEDRNGYLVDQVVQPRLEAIDGISRVEIFGVLDDSMRILLDEQRVEAAQLDLGALVRRLANDNFAQPMGEIEDGSRRFLLRSDMRFKTPEEIGAYPVGKGLRLRDLGEVKKVKSVRDQLTRIDGQYSYFGLAWKDSQSNVVEVSHALRERLEDMQELPELQGKLNFLVFGTQGDFIESTLSQLRNTALIGGALAVAVLLVFLRRIRLTLCVALAIPVSALLAVAWEYFTGGSFNVLTMAGLTMAIGMVVDDSIVVVENIARLRAQRVAGTQAAVVGASEIALAVTLSTLTSVVVFLPMIFMTEHPVLRAIFGALGRPVCTSLMFSLLVALVFLPVVAARILDERPRRLQRIASALEPIALLPARALRALWSVARLLLRAAGETARQATLAPARALAPLRWGIAGAVLGLGVWLWWSARPGLREFDSLGLSGPALDPLQLGALAQYLLPALLVAFLAVYGLPRARRTLATGLAPMKPLPARVLGLLELVEAGNRHLVAWSLQHRGAAVGLALLACASVWIPIRNMKVSAFGQDSNTDYLQFDIEFESDFTLEEASEQMAVYESYIVGRKAELGFDHYSSSFRRRGGEFELYWDDRQPPSRLVGLREDLRLHLPRLAGQKVRFWGQNEDAERGKTLTRFTLNGPDSQELDRIGKRAVRLLEGVPGLSGVSSPLEEAPEQLQVTFDRDLAHGLGVPAQAAQETISWALAGFQLPRFQEAGREIPFLIEYDSAQSAGLETLRDLSVFGGSSRVALSAFADISVQPGSRTIYRENGQTTFTIQARIDDPTRTAEINQAGMRALATLELPRGFSIGTRDSAQARQESEFAELLRALILSIVLIFMLMGMLFESMLLPISVLFTIPFAIVGSYWCLYLTGTTMDSVGYIGFIILAGVVVKNGIVLVDCFHRLRREGMPRDQAVVEGCARRLRPVLMTALATIFGLLPMALEEPSSNSLDYRALATCVAGGLGVSTLFTLSVVPLGYVLLDDLAGVLGSRVRWWLRPLRWRRRAAAEPVPVPETAS